MSQHNDEHFDGPSNSFWEVGNYKWTTKRIEDGHRLCDDFMKLIQERAEIEKNYAKNLKDWSKKWNHTIVKGPEYGTTEAGWLAMLSEADQRCDLHTKVKENLLNDVYNNLKGWQKDHYHKSVIMGQLKEKKDIEDMFRKAQKQWAKLYDKCARCKQDYHNACKGEKSAQNQERNAGGDSSISPDQVKKLQDRVSKARDEVAKTKERYNQALSEISSFNPKYIEEMTHVFDKAQEFEQQRLEFFKTMLFSTHKCLNISQDPSLPKIYEEMYHTVSNADYGKDLKWWSNKYGVNMPMSWPSFEEYSEEFRNISSKGRAKGHIPEGAITLINSRPVDDELSTEYNPDATRTKRSLRPLAGHDSSKKNAHDESPVPQKNRDLNRNSSASNGVSGDDEDWDCSDRVIDPKKPGVPVVALYDYEGVEEDELSFKLGEQFEKLEDEDEQGWCTGRKDGRIGLYPANYVETV